MRPTTLRLPEDTLDALDSEYREYGYRDRSEYVRAIIEHRDPPYADTQTTTDYARMTTDDYERLRQRVADLESRIEDLEDDGGEVLSYDEKPQGSGVEDTDADGVVEWGRANQPVSRSDIVAAFEEEWRAEGIKGDSWWRRHAKRQLEEAGFEYRRNVGWQKR